MRYFWPATALRLLVVAVDSAVPDVVWLDPAVRELVRTVVKSILCAYLSTSDIINL